MFTLPNKKKVLNLPEQVEENTKTLNTLKKDTADVKGTVDQYEGQISAITEAQAKNEKDIKTALNTANTAKTTADNAYDLASPLSNEIELANSRAAAAVQSSLNAVNQANGAVQKSTDNETKIANNASDISALSSRVSKTESGLTLDQQNLDRMQLSINELQTGKQNALSTTQLNAVNSGITTSKVNKYDGYDTKITSLDTAVKSINSAVSTVDGSITTGTILAEKTSTFGSDVIIDGNLNVNEFSDITNAHGDNIQSEIDFKQNKLNDDQLAAINSGITSNKVTTYDAYDNRISTINTTVNALDKRVKTLEDNKDLDNIIDLYNREAYQYLFAGQTLIGFVEEGSTSFNPEFSFRGLINATDIRGMFAGVKLQESTINVLNIIMPAFKNPVASTSVFVASEIRVIEFNSATYNTSYMCYQSDKLERVLVVDGADVKFRTYGGDFISCSSLTEIGAIDMSTAVNLQREFTGCASLKSIHCKHWRISFDISASTKFETDDLVEIISNLDSVTTSQTLTMGATNLAKLTDDQIKVATDKGWTLA